jgi:hypothetical protein
MLAIASSYTFEEGEKECVTPLSRPSGPRPCCTLLSFSLWCNHMVRRSHCFPVLLGTLCDLVAIPPTPSTSGERQMRKPNQVLNSCADHAPQPPTPSSHTRTRTPHLSSWDWIRDLLYKRHHYSIVQSPTPAAPNCTFNRNVLTHHTAPIHSQIAFINYKRSYASLRATSNL